jgi:hypothetical protein
VSPSVAGGRGQYNGAGGQNGAGDVVPSADDCGGALWWLAGFLMGLTTIIVPIILIVLWNKEYPLRTKSILKGFIVSIIISAIVSIIIASIMIPYVIDILTDISTATNKIVLLFP